MCVDVTGQIIEIKVYNVTCCAETHDKLTYLSWSLSISIINSAVTLLFTHNVSKIIKISIMFVCVFILRNLRS